MNSEIINREAITLLKNLIALPSFSKEEDKTAAVIFNFLLEKNVKAERILNNIYACNIFYDEAKPNLLFCSHHDTVRPNAGYSKNPFAAIEVAGKLFGLGSNDAGGCLVSLLMTFLHFYEQENLKYNLIFVAAAEEEISGKNGIELALQQLPKIDLAIIGEPTGLNAAVAEKGLMVLDCVSIGVAGHAARGEGENAIYKALKDISWFQNYKFPKVSEFLGPVKMTVTSIETENKTHNSIPAQCKFIVDIRVTDVYTHQEILDIIKGHTNCNPQPRSMRLKASSISPEHELVRAAASLGAKLYGSPTSSDAALITAPVLKIGPGESERSHTADEFIYIDEIEKGIAFYKKLLQSIL